jgi:hypothetical protein
MQLDWEVGNYDFRSRGCRYSWHDIRLVALQSDLRKYPGAKAGDLMVTFPNNGNAVKIIEYFQRTHDNFRHGCLAKDGSTDMVNVFLAPIA